jgi:hypothetical protein
MPQSSVRPRPAGAPQLALPVNPGLPIDPRQLVDLEPIERGRLYNAVDGGCPDGGLDSWQRGCVEQAIRLIRAGRYPEVAA